MNGHLLSTLEGAPIILAVGVFVYFWFAMKRECAKLNEPRDSGRTSDGPGFKKGS